MIGWSLVLSGIGVATGVLVFLRVVANHLAVLEHRLIKNAASRRAEAEAKQSTEARTGGQ